MAGRLLLQVEGEAICAVPPQWTDQVALDPELVISNRRALVRVEDLMELARVVDHLCKRIKENGR